MCNKYLTKTLATPVLNAEWVSFKDPSSLQERREAAAVSPAVVAHVRQLSGEGALARRVRRRATKTLSQAPHLAIGCVIRPWRRAARALQLGILFCSSRTGVCVA